MLHFSFIFHNANSQIFSAVWKKRKTCNVKKCSATALRSSEHTQTNAYYNTTKIHEQRSHSHFSRIWEWMQCAQKKPEFNFKRGRRIRHSHSYEIANRIENSFPIVNTRWRGSFRYSLYALKAVSRASRVGIVYKQQPSLEKSYYTASVIHRRWTTHVCTSANKYGRE